MVIDRERLQLLVYKYAGKCQEAWDAQRAMNAAHKEANAVMDEITAYLEEVNAANEKMDGELARLRKAEAERASIKPEPKPEHTCRECRYIQQGERMPFCMNKGPGPFVGVFESDIACEKFEPRLVELAAKVDAEAVFHITSEHTCGECLSWADDKMQCNGTGACLNRNCNAGKRGEMDAACAYFEARKED